MKSNIVLHVIIVAPLALGLFAGCSNNKFNRINPDELRDFTHQPPFKLLPPEKAHEVTINLVAKSPLSNQDNLDIAKFISRMPGFRKYEIKLIKKSSLFSDAFDVFVPPYNIVMKKADAWEAIRIYAPAF
jgi:hypothetical protein